MVSVVIPVYNGERYLADALDSVFAQDYQPFEVIVVDDGSVDGSSTVVSHYKEARYLHQPNQGVAVARNTGIAASRGEFVAFLDQDDLWPSHKLRVQMDFVMKNSHVDYFLTRQKVFLDPGVEPPVWLKNESLECDQTGFLPGTLIAKKSLFSQIGDFDASYITASDAEWFFRAKDAHIPMAVIPEILLYKRIHLGNQSAQVGAAHLELLKITRASIRRKHGFLPRENVNDPK